MNERPSKQRSDRFPLLAAVATVGNAISGFVLYVALGGGSLAPWLHDLVGSTPLGLFTAIGVGALFGVIVTPLAYIASLDPHRTTRPTGGLYVLFASLAFLVAGVVLGGTEVGPDNFPALGVTFLVVVLVPFGLLLAEKTLGRMATSFADALHGRGATAGLLTFSRLGLALRPKDSQGEKVFALGLVESGKLDEARGYLEKVYERGDRDPDLMNALGRVYDEAGEKSHAADIYEELYTARPSQKLLGRLVQLWRETDNQRKAIEVLHGLDSDKRPQWLDMIRDLLVEVGDGDGLRALAHEFERDGRPFRRARECYAQLVEKDPEDASAIEALAEIHVRLGEEREAARLWEQLVTLGQDRSAYRRRLIDYYRNQGSEHEIADWAGERRTAYQPRVQASRDTVLRHIEALIDEGEASLDEKLEVLNEKFSLGDYREVERLVATNRDVSRSAQGTFVLASALFESGRIYEAQTQITQARELEPDHELKGRITSLESRIRSAVLESQLRDLSRRVRENPGDLDLRFEYIDRLAANGSIDKVVAELEELLASDAANRDRVVSEIEKLLGNHGENFRLLDYLSDIHFREHNLDQVHELLLRKAKESMHPDQIIVEGATNILHEKPDHLPALLSMVHYNIRRSNDIGALEYLDRYFAAGGERTQELLLVEFEACERAGEVERAGNTGQELLRLNPTDVQLLLYFANNQMAARKYTEAIGYLQRASAIEPDDRSIRRLIKECEEKRKRARIDELKERLDDTPSDVRMREELGDLYHDFGQLTEAIIEYQKAALSDRSHNVPRAKLGYVLLQKGLYTDAEEALAETELKLDQSAEEQLKIKALFYSAAELFEEDHQATSALQLYKRIFRIDAGYRDVVQRVERLQHAGNKKKKP